MRLLLDTHIFIWASAGDARLPAAARAAILDTTNFLAVSAVTAWEIAIKHAAGRLAFPVSKWNEMLAALDAAALPMTAAHCFAAGALPRHHNDPFDRMLVAQARLEGLSIVTVDPMIQKYDVVVYQGAGG